MENQRMGRVELIADIQQLRERNIEALDACYNYFFNTQGVWRIVSELLAQGHEFSFEIQPTDTTIHGRQLPDLAQQYITGYLASATFQHFISIFEDFIFGFIRAWLVEHPESLSKKQLDLRAVLDAADKTEIIRVVVVKEINEQSYKKVEQWFEYLESLVKLDYPGPDQIQRLAEIKASRDILVHNNGIVNAIYIEKSGIHARFSIGDTLTVHGGYHHDSWTLIKQVITELADAAFAKLGA